MLDMDSTVKTVYRHQEGAEVGYNPHKPGRPSHAYHTYMLSSLRLVLRVDVLPGDRYKSPFGWAGPEILVQPRKYSCFSTAESGGSYASANDHRLAKVM
jgi:hypothetical protein